MSESLKRVSLVLLALALTLGLTGVLTLGITNNANAVVADTCKDISEFADTGNLEKNSSGDWGEIKFKKDNGPLEITVNNGYTVVLCIKKGSSNSGQGPIVLDPIDGPVSKQKVNYPNSDPKDGFSHYSYYFYKTPTYFFQFAKEWAGDKVNLDGVEVTFFVGDLEWRLGDDPVAVEPGEVLAPLSEEVTGLPANCTYKSNLPESYTVFEDLVPSDVRALTTQESTQEPMLDTLPVTNTVTCKTTVTPEGETETPVTTVAATTQVTATPTGAVDAGAGADLIASLAGLMGSAAVIAGGLFLRRFSVVSL